MAEKNNKPEIRFKGFTDDWEEHELGDLLGITSACRVHKNEWTESGVPFFRSSDVVADYKGLENNKAFISFELYEELSNKSGCLQKNDLLITGGGSIAIPYLVKTNVPLYFKDGDLLWLKNTNNINGYFLYTFFSTLAFRCYVNSITHIGTISHYTIEQAKSTPIRVPEKEEQDEIGEYLTNLDTLITLHQCKYDKLVTVKKAMLEKMFPQNGAVVPEIRFKGFTDNWEVRELGRVYNFQYGQFNNNPSDGGIYPVYGANGIIGRFSKYNAEDSVIIGHMGENAGSVLWGDGKHFVTYNGTISRPKSFEINPKYGYYMLFQLNIEKICGGSGQPFLSYETLQKLNCVFPLSIEEQIKIAEYFKQLDNLITLQQHELGKLKNIKKACLLKMFV